MKRNRICNLCLLGALALALLSCLNGSDKEYYELVGGNPDIDFLEFLGDSTCLFVAPGPVEMTCPYVEKDGVITVSVIGFVKGKLYREDKNTLRGEAPFFEGTWKKTRPHRESGIKSEGSD
ncbi:MAG: hypothetical protein J5698_07235 [Bacteroidaceae bacterium]|nr:hypothetical protein [Bacteroidaceae bacterium]